MKVAKALIAWTRPREHHPKYRSPWYPGPGLVKVGPLIHAGKPNWTVGYDCTGGAAWTATRKLSGDDAKLRIYLDAWHLVVVSGLPPNGVHEAFLEIDEYRDGLSGDFGEDGRYLGR